MVVEEKVVVEAVVEEEVVEEAMAAPAMVAAAVVAVAAHLPHVRAHHDLHDDAPQRERHDQPDEQLLRPVTPTRSGLRP